LDVSFKHTVAISVAGYGPAVPKRTFNKLKNKTKISLKQTRFKEGRKKINRIKGKKFNSHIETF